ncbi:MAG: hypothetical protein KIT33_12840 [Candidatus Kapabacteria bacterium]|nr:hypothetical protein [Ignavibacteriota bacterium]MCW5885848.1 hypothetical protein [Candidatus Kapabacteria bacterium]
MNFLKLSLIIVTSISLAFLSSCSESNNIAGSDSLSPDQLSVFEYNVENFEITEATIDSDIKLDELQPMRPDGKLDERRLPPHVRNKIILQRVIRAMELDDEQMAALRELLNKHHICEIQWFRKLQAVRQAIVQRANVERREIMQQVKSGDITREQAQRLINQLNQKVREAMINNPALVEIREGLKDCRDELFDAIAELLNEEQLEIWERFLNSLK